MALNNEYITVKEIYKPRSFKKKEKAKIKEENPLSWEIIYIESGSLRLKTSVRTVKINQGEAIFNKCGQEYDIEPRGEEINIISICFEAESPNMSFFENKAFKLNKQQRELIYKIAEEKNEESGYAASQLAKIYLEELLILLVRSNNALTLREKRTGYGRKTESDEVFNSIIDYLEQNIDKNITLDNVCEHFYFSKTYIKTLFKNKTGNGLIAYYNRIKLEKAKKLIELKEYSFTEISEMLSYSSVHYFSRCFKHYVGITPTEYAETAKEELKR